MKSAGLVHALLVVVLVPVWGCAVPVRSAPTETLLKTVPDGADTPAPAAKPLRVTDFDAGCGPEAASGTAELEAVINDLLCGTRHTPAPSAWLPDGLLYADTVGSGPDKGVQVAGAQLMAGPLIAPAAKPLRVSDFDVDADCGPEAAPGTGELEAVITGWLCGTRHTPAPSAWLPDGLLYADTVGSGPDKGVQVAGAQLMAGPLIAPSPFELDSHCLAAPAAPAGTLAEVVAHVACDASGTFPAVASGHDGPLLVGALLTQDADGADNSDPHSTGPTAPAPGASDGGEADCPTGGDGGTNGACPELRVFPREQGDRDFGLPGQFLLGDGGALPPGTKGTGALVPSPFSGVEGGCPVGPPVGPLDLAETVTRALCSNPRSRQSWAAARAQAARVGIERAAFLPAASVSLGADRNYLKESEKVIITEEETGISERATLSDESTNTSLGASLEFTWLLFDFGQQKALVENARQTLLAATATHDATVQSVFLEAASAHCALVAAQNALALEREKEQFSLRTLARVREQIDAGDEDDIDDVDMLQAKSTAAEATLDRGRAEGALRRARGELAVLLGLAPNYELSALEGSAPVPGKEVVRSIGDLLEQARIAHPAIKAAHAEVAGARATLDAASRGYRPTVSLVQGNFREYDGVDRWQSSLALQVSIPLYEPTYRNRRREAEAELEFARAEARSQEQAVALEVWTAFQDLQTEAAALEQLGPMLENAKKLLEVEQDLYADGDGSMLDLIYAQQSVAFAAREFLEALTNWRIARLQLAASLGELGFWAIGDASAR